jgi:hypothetical protein
VSPSNSGKQPGAFHLRLRYWREYPIETGKASHADFVRLQVSAHVAYRIDHLRATSGFTANTIWGVLVYSYLRHASVPAVDLFTAYSLRDPGSHGQPLSKACLIDVREATFGDEPPDLPGCIGATGEWYPRTRHCLAQNPASPRTKGRSRRYGATDTGLH